MDIVAYIALILSIISIVIMSVTLLKTYKYIKTLVDEIGISVITHKRYRKVKRYILIKFLCINNNYTSLADYIRYSVYKTLGPILRHRCDVDVISYRPSSRRAILRVRGEAVCVLYTLLALSIQHISDETRTCIAIPIRVSGLISRLRRRYLKA